MPLSSGTKLGQYEVVEAIGAGGMGEVYRARDTKLGRDVAIKVLPEEFARDKERLDRFEREARLLAQLNHANIATLYGLEEHGGQRFIVMELVEGETLADCIAKGPVPIDEAVPLFIHIAEGLEAAHEKAIVHRDLKPANIMIGPDGKPKILDFGLAKAFVGNEAVPDSSQSPTLTKGTALGAIMGTAAYMSPEQARGKRVDRRTDIWAFGCVLFEALTGRKPFDGDNVTDILAAVVKNEPSWHVLPADTTGRVRELLRLCLRKDAARRLQHAGDARIALEEAIDEPEVTFAGTPSRPFWRRAIPLVAFGMLVSGFAVWSIVSPAPEEPGRVTRFAVESPPFATLGNQRSLTLSRDGSLLAYVSRKDDAPATIELRAMDQLEPRVLSGTIGAAQPFFSPDREWVGFYAEGQLKKVPITEGSAVTLVSSASFHGAASWGDDDTIVFSTESGLARVSASGGTVEPLTTLDGEPRGTFHRWPEVLAGSETVLFTVNRGRFGSRIDAVSVATGERKTVLEDATDARYSSSGHLVFLRSGRRSGTLHAAPFDLDRLETLGPAVPLVEDILVTGGGAGNFALSRDGTLVYSEARERELVELVRVDRSGGAETLRFAGYVRRVRLSPDGSRVATSISEAGSSHTDVWTYDLRRDTMSRLTFEGWNNEPIWSPDGTWIYFTSNRDGTFQFYRKRADGRGEAEKLTSFDERPALTAHSVSPDGNFLAFTYFLGGGHLGLLDLKSGGPPDVALEPDSEQVGAAFSPDGRFLAYASSESGRFEIYVRTFPGQESRWQMSNTGGREPMWSADGRKLYFRNADAMMVVSVETGDGLIVGRARPLFQFENTAASFDVFDDGQHFLMLKRVGERPTETIHVVLNFDEELKRLVPTDN